MDEIKKKVDEDWKQKVEKEKQAPKEEGKFTPPDPDFKFHLVEDQAQLEVWAQTAFAGFELKPEVRKKFFESVNNFDIVHSHQLFLYLGSMGDLPVSTSLLFLGEGVAGIYWVSTIPEARNKGLGSAVTYKTVMEAKRIGYPVAVLEASEMGFKVYRGLGFKEYFRFGLYGLQ